MTESLILYETKDEDFDLLKKFLDKFTTRKNIQVEIMAWNIVWCHLTTHSTGPLSSTKIFF